jgi:hypothetical protein
MSKIIELLASLLKALFGGGKAKKAVAAPLADDETPTPKETEAPDPEPEDQPEEEVDDPDYDVENETPDDDTERDELPEPDADTVEAVEKAMVPLDPWKQRQQWLKDAGYDPGPIDGKPGRKTNKAVEAFQKGAGLKVDGEWGPKTEKAIKAALKDKDVSVPPYVAPPPTFGKPKYEDMIGDVELDDAFFACFVDLTKKANIKDKKGRRLRKGIRKHSKLTRICWHQTAFTWKPYAILKALKKWSSHHKINAHALFDTDGAILLLHNFFYYLWTANAFNGDCFSFEVMGNFEGIQGSGRWYKGDKFGRARPKRIQIIRGRQMIKWLLDPEQGPADDKLPKPLLEWREGCRKHGNPLKWNNTHREATDNRGGDCGSEYWYHVGFWGIENNEAMSHGPTRGKGMKLPDVWWQKPPAPPLPLDGV